MREYPSSMIIEITPTPKDGTEWGENKYFVSVDTDPAYPGIDGPIEINFGQYCDRKDSLELEPEDAEQLAKALLRAVEIRRAVFGLSAPVQSNVSDHRAAPCDAVPAVDVTRSDASAC